MAQDTAPIIAGLRVRPQDHDPHNPNFISDFSNFLVHENFIDHAGADRAKQAQNQTGHRYDLVLAQLGVMSDIQILKAFSIYFAIDVVEPCMFPLTPVLEAKLDAAFVKRNRVLPLYDSEDMLTVAICDPFNTDTQAAIAYLLNKPVTPKLSLTRDLDAEILRLYDTEANNRDNSAGGDDQTVQITDDDLQRLRDIASEAPIIRLVNRVIAAATEQRASDIHIEPLASDIRVRLRIDGVMSETERLPLTMLAGINSRIKILSKLNIAERRLPQDGRTKFVVGGRSIDLRISTMPTLHGESMVLRLLDTDSVDLNFAALGFDSGTSATLSLQLAMPNGIVLVTGPTGSGKTTTLYAALKQLNSIERKIFTVEDPIEYQLAGINQIQIKPAIGLDFAHCLRSILRQDPDVIMVGEMRDQETARMGIQASLTGHLVLSTLHTNDAVSAITRLLDMGLEDYLLSSSLAAVIAQRLVRKLCPHCAELMERSADKIQELLREFSLLRQPAAPFSLKNATGCSYCRHSGYLGRTSIIEVLVIDEQIKQILHQGAAERDLSAAGLANGMETLYQNALRKALAGETSLDEVLRVTRM